MIRGDVLALDGGTVGVGRGYSPLGHSTSCSTSESSSEPASVTCSGDVACMLAGVR
jgi:hypothetical protein